MTRASACVLLVAAALVSQGCGNAEHGSSTKPTHRQLKTPPKAAPSTAKDLSHGAAGTAFASADLAPDGRPSIEIVTPRPLDVVAKEFAFTGTAYVNEGHVQLELVDGNQKIVVSTFATATCGTGCRGRFRKLVQLRAVPAANYTLRVFEPSAKDGSRLHEASFPVTVHATEDPKAKPPPGLDVE